MSSDSEVSECPECGVGVKSRLTPDRDLDLSELTKADVEQGEYFFCLMCEVAWDANERIPYELPVSSPTPGGFISEITAGKAISEQKTSNYRLLGYSDEGDLMLRDVGNLAFARNDAAGPPHPEQMQDQLGEVIQVVGSGYPKPIQTIINALRPGYCIHATIGESDSTGEKELDATETCRFSETVPVDYAVETEYIPEFADDIWREDFNPEQSGGPIPHARRTLHAEGVPAADVYVFPKGIQNEQGIPLLACIQRGMTHHLEKFTTNFTGVFTGGVIDVLFIAPKERPYFAVYCLGGDCKGLVHELRSELGLPVVHRGREFDNSRVFDIRYNPLYVERTTDTKDDLLVPVNGEDGKIDIRSGEVEGEYFEWQPVPHEVVVTISEPGKTVEVARLRAPSARIGQLSTYSGGVEDNRLPSSGSEKERSGENVTSHSLSDVAMSRLTDIVKLQPTSNGELADAWDFTNGKEVYQYLTAELDEYYYRDEDKYIRATDRAKRLVRNS